ncbi:MAG: hypothetical protein JXB29_04270 [Sedimentisphaerales bacterium]|nr:hypothetical protein [Sedimentisphaerales bacterium]
MITEFYKGKIIVTHPHGLKCICDESDMEKERTHLQQRIAELNDQIVRLDIDIAQMKASEEG